MLYHLFYSLKDYISGFNIFRYITFRAALAAFTSLSLSLLFGPLFIRKLSSFFHPNLLSFHSHKEKTPTMGGLLILGSVIIATIFWADLTNKYIWLCLFTMLWLGTLGFFDDLIKLRRKDGKGMRPLSKILWQVSLGFLLGSLLLLGPFDFSPTLSVPFFKGLVINLVGFYILLVILIIVSTSNAVNLTDGLDGLAIGSVLMIAVAYGVMTYLSGHYKFAAYLQIPFIKFGGELTVFCGALIGASLGFLWFNAHPAQIFMGDTGALSLGGVLGLIAILIKQEISLLFVGGIFVIEALSVIIQVTSFKLRKKRVFAMTPLHHHFEIRGWPESKIVVRFWIISIIFLLFSLLTLKIR